MCKIKEYKIPNFMYGYEFYNKLLNLSDCELCKIILNLVNLI